MPYNSLVDLFRVLNQTVVDPAFFNRLVDFQIYFKQNFIHDHLEKLSSRVFSLDKRKISELDIPHKRRIQVPETIPGSSKAMI